MNVSPDEQSIFIWPNSFRPIQALESLAQNSAEDRSFVMSCFSSVTEQEIIIPCYGCVVFPSDTLHSGAANPTSNPRFRGFCIFQGNQDNLGFKNVLNSEDEIHHVRNNDLKT